MSQQPEEFQGAVPPMTVGRFYNAEHTRVLLPFSALEAERSRRAMVRILSTFHFRTESNVLLTAQFDEAAQLLGAERAIMSYGMVAVSADSTPWDAGRVESIIRRFKLVAALGISEITLDGLERLGFDPLQLFQDMVVWARPGAYERLVDKPGMKVFRWLEIGPAVAAECSAGAGAHIDRFEWNIALENDELVLESRLERSMAFEGYRTGIKARIERGTCQCGNTDPRIVLKDV
jgi:hypothetical protein